MMFALYAGKALGFLKAVPWQAWLVGAVLLTAWIWGNHRYEQGKDAIRPLLAAERAQHAVTRQSLATLTDELEGMVRDGELRAERLAEARRETKETTDGLREQAARIAAQRASVGDPCVTPDAVRESGL